MWRPAPKDASLSDEPMTTFTPLDPATFPGSPALRDLRQQALERFSANPLPTDADEIWRYSRIGELDVAKYPPATPRALKETPAPVVAALQRIGARSAYALTVDGALAAVEVHDDGVRVHAAAVEDGVGETTAR